MGAMKTKPASGPSRCATCRHYVREREPYIPNAGDCRFDPPKIVDETHRGAWPVVAWDALCGRHSRRLVPVED